MVPRLGGLKLEPPLFSLLCMVIRTHGLTPLNCLPVSLPSDALATSTSSDLYICWEATGHDRALNHDTHHTSPTTGQCPSTMSPTASPPPVSVSPPPSQIDEHEHAQHDTSDLSQQSIDMDTSFSSSDGNNAKHPRAKRKRTRYDASIPMSYIYSPHSEKQRD